MSCPYFYPTETRGGGALLPLGGFWTGMCHADSARPVEADESSCCNLGYARGRCPRFPSGEGPDAVRFTISDDSDPGNVRVYYVIERDHHPFAHGPLDLSAAAPLLARQGAAYLESYHRRKGVA